MIPPIKKKSELRAGGDGGMRGQVWREEEEEESTERDCWKGVVISRSGKYLELGNLPGIYKDGPR